MDYKVSETSRKTLYEAAQKRNDENVIAIIDFFGEGLPPPEYSYHRRCYQRYAHGKLKVHSESKRVQKRESSRKKKLRRYHFLWELLILYDVKHHMPHIN